MTGSPELPSAARSAILAWYDVNGRSLPFRGTRDPYAILVSEAMAQQTQAARAGEAWIRFLARFPTVQALAAARPSEVLRAWQGLGYNRRALALWRAAQAIVTDHGGVVPSDLAALEALPGVGPYTARAVAAIAFGVPVGAVDTNVRRVLGRIVAGDADALGRPAMQRLADTAVPVERPGDWTHAVMDVGATICRSGRPKCGACPARAWCAYGRRACDGIDGEQPAMPGRRARRPSPAFPTTSRWLRGRIMDRLRAASDGEWVELAGPIGSHDADAVATAVRALASEGLIEHDPSATTMTARLPIG